MSNKVLLEFKEMSASDMYHMVHEIYAEASYENAQYNHPELEDLTAAIQEEEKYFMGFLERFFKKEENTYYVLTVEDRWVSALRLTKMDDFYYMESLETTPEYRKHGYAFELINEVIDLLKQRGSVSIRSNVRKTNIASVETHKKCGFIITEEQGKNYLTGTSRDDVYGMLYTEK